MSFNGAVLIDPTGDFCLSSVDAFTTDVMTRTDKICPYGGTFVERKYHWRKSFVWEEEIKGHQQIRKSGLSFLTFPDGLVTKVDLLE